VHVFASPLSAIVLNEQQTLDGGGVLPGFALKVARYIRRAAAEFVAVNRRVASGLAQMRPRVWKLMAVRRVASQRVIRQSGILIRSER